ncbi:hypothetical protein N9N03_02370 [Chlamydiia bacterium]|nr:hypothetical protein [Chlamydiia bacterium]
MNNTVPIPQTLLPDLDKHRRLYLMAVIKTVPFSLYELVRDTLHFTQLMIEYTNIPEVDRNWDAVMIKAAPLGKNIIYATANIAAIITLVIPILGYPGILVDEHKGSNDTLLGLIIPPSNHANQAEDDSITDSGKKTEQLVAARREQIIAVLSPGRKKPKEETYCAEDRQEKTSTTKPITSKKPRSTVDDMIANLANLRELLG